MNKPKRIDARKHQRKNFNHLLKYNPSKIEAGKELTVRNDKGKSVIRNMDGITKPLIFSDINYLLTGSQSLTDIDGVFEYNGNLFIIEEKTHYNSVNGGQLISLFNIAFNTYKVGKIAQLVYRIRVGEGVYNYEFFGSKQFEAFDKGEEFKPDLIKAEGNEYLARRLRQFQEACNNNWDRDREKRKSLIFKVVNYIKTRASNLKGVA